jgi:hypothetical protein
MDKSYNDGVSTQYKYTTGKSTKQEQKRKQIYNHASTSNILAHRG